MDVTVIIPVYNGEQTIERCILSAAKQEVSEILVVDDGSEDNTLDLLTEMQVHYPSIRVVHHEHSGVSEARNTGIREAKTEWLMFLDADDWLTDKAISEFEGCSDPETDACCGGIIRGNKKKASQRIIMSRHVFTDTHELLDYAMEEPTDRLTIHGWIIRREILTRNNILFNPELRYGEDSEFMLRILTVCRQVVFLDVPIYHYAISVVSTTNKWQSGKTEEYLKTLEEIRKTNVVQEKNWPLFVLSTLLLLFTHVTFHPANPANKREQLLDAKCIRMMPVFEDAFNKADLNKTGFVKRFVLRQIQANRMAISYLAVKIRQWQNKYYANEVN